MKELLFFLKIFIPLYALVAIFVEEKRKRNNINKFLLLLFSVIVIKELFYYILITVAKNKESVYFSKFLLLHYTFYSIYLFALTYTIIQLIADNKKIISIYFAFWIILFLGIISIALLRLEFDRKFEIILQVLFGTGILLTFIKLNTTYFGEDDFNVIVKNKTIVNTVLILIIFLIMFFPKSTGNFKSFVELIIYGLLWVLNYHHIKEGYIELETDIKDLKYEANILLDLLERVGGALSTETKFDEVLKTVTDYSAEVLNVRSAAILTVSKDKKHLIPRYVYGFYPPVEKIEGYAATKEKFLIERFKTDKIEIGKSYLGEVAKKGEPLLIQDAMNDPSIVQSAKGLMDIRTVIVVPLKFQEEVVGVISFLNKIKGGSFTRAEFRLAQTLANQVAVTLNNFRLYNEMLVKQREERDVEIAGDIQRQLLPKEYPKIDKVELFGFSKAAKGVGGDYYDFLNFDNTRVGVIMADVAGKGVPAALVMVMIRSILHSVARKNISPSQIITFINKMLTGQVSQERYATMFYYLLDVPTEKLYFTNAAHGPLLIFRKNKNEFEMLDTPGLPVGITEEQKYGQGVTRISEGDIAILYTDGITEARNVDKEEFTIDRVKEIIKENSDKSAIELGNTLIEQINEFVGEAPQHDDETIVILKFK